MQANVNSDIAAYSVAISKPSAYATDYCTYPVASLEVDKLTLANDQPLPGFEE